MLVIDGKNTHITSDTHFGHGNIIKYCNRKFNSVSQMDDYIIKSWNETAGKDDTVIHLGDVSFHPDKYINNLNGRIILIAGNHDNRKYNKLYEGVAKSLPIMVGDFKCYFTHIPIDAEANWYKEGSEPDLTILDKYDFIICGHVHEKWVVKEKNINVGFDVWNRLISVYELIKFINRVKLDRIRNLKSLSDIGWIQN